METIKLLDLVALTEAHPEQGLQRGEVGTVVEVLAPDIFEVEFSDDSGEAYAFASLRAEQLVPLYYRKRAAQAVPEAA
jgi:hypothetical protein